MDVVITNSADLKLEIERLKGIKADQETAIKQHFNSPRAILGTITSFFYKPDTGEEAAIVGLRKYDFSALISKYLLPLTLNTTLFRKSNFVIKALVALASRKAAGLLKDKHIAELWDKIKPHLPDTLIQKITPKKRRSLFSFLLPKKQISLKTVSYPASNGL